MDYNKENPPKYCQSMGILTPGEQRNTEYLKLKYFPSNPEFVRLEKINVPDEESLENRKQMFHGNLYRTIKRKLVLAGKRLNA